MIRNVKPFLTLVILMNPSPQSAFENFLPLVRDAVNKEAYGGGSRPVTVVPGCREWYLE
jgi:hypothetical protein